MRPSTFALFPALTVLAVGCTTGIALTDGGARVHHVQRVDMPAGCRVIGDVGIGIPPDAAMPRTEDELIVLMRNKTYEQGGNLVVLESAEQRDTNDDGEAFWRGRGTSFHCPDDAFEAPAEEGSSSGGEAGGEGADEGSGETGGDGEGDGDDDLDDLLGE
ncbi:MAG: hypothetical protein AB7S26_03370 [Sandaracinaceae bacterium]